MAAASFWSTALTEILAVLILFSSFARHLLRFSIPEGNATQFDNSARTRIAVILWIVYFGCVLLSFLVSGTPLTRHPGLIWHPILFLAVLGNSWERKTLERAARVFLASGAIASIVSICISSMQHPHKALFSFIGLTTFADLAAMASIVAVAFFVSPGSKRSTRAWIGILGFCTMVGTFQSSERAPVLALIIVGGMIAVSSRSRASVIWLSAVLICTVLSPAVLLGKFQFLVQQRSDDRSVAWKEGLKLARHIQPFGYGPDCYLRVLPADAWQKFMNKPPGSWHNDILQTTLDSGPIASASLVGLISLILLFSSVVAFRFRKEANCRRLAVLVVLLGVCVGFSLVGGVFSTAVLGSVFWLLLGFTLQETLKIYRPN